MKEHVVTDEFGRRTVFTGEHLVCQTTDNTLSVKPQWLEVDVWRTEAGKYVVRRTTCYRVRHRSENCAKAEGYDLVVAGPDDTYECSACQALPNPISNTNWAQTPRITVDVYDTPQALILGFQNEGRFNNLARTILYEVSGQDDRVDAVWNTVVVP